MPGSNGQENIDAFYKTGSIFFPYKVMKVHAYGVHTQGCCPAQFTVDGFGIKTAGLPHFQFIDGRAGNKIASYEPWLFGIPLVGSFFRPYSSCSDLRMTFMLQAKKYEQCEYFFHGYTII